jgi:NAD(P)-dependent dehydrogenase (short-subunit alcohol dehydrogenase family)
MPTLSNRVKKLFHIKQYSGSMSPVILITGVSGYIGGEVVNVFSKKHPEWKLVALVRNTEQAQSVKTKYPTVETVIGTLDDHNLLVKQGGLADVVLRKSHPIIQMNVKLMMAKKLHLQIISRLAGLSSRG